MDITVKLHESSAPVLSSLMIKRSLGTFLRHCGVKDATVSVVFVSGRTMRKINKKYLGHDFVTDVITFDYSLSRGNRLSRCLFIDGEIFVCPQEAVRNAKVFGVPVKREILRYLAHGILHLLGQEDATKKQRMLMQEKENDLLAQVM
jgi:probable rRNA maturation factor